MANKPKKKSGNKSDNKNFNKLVSIGNPYYISSKGQIKSNDVFNKGTNKIQKKDSAKGKPSIKPETKKNTKKQTSKKSTSWVDAINDWADRNFRTAINKSASDLNKKLQTKIGDPIRKAVYGDKKKESSKKEQSKKVKSTIESLKRPDIRKKTIKPEVVVKPKTPTVSQLWQEKTGTSWSEAKKQGFTDGSASSNVALMKKLKSGEINKNNLSKPKTETTPTPVTTTPTTTPEPKKVMTGYSGSGMGAMERAEKEFEEQGFRRGGSVKKMRKKISVKRKK